MRCSSPRRYSVSTVSSVRQAIRSYIVPSESDDMHRRHRAQITNALIADYETAGVFKNAKQLPEPTCGCGERKVDQVLSVSRTGRNPNQGEMMIRKSTFALLTVTAAASLASPVFGQSPTPYGDVRPYHYES